MNSNICIISILVILPMCICQDEKTIDYVYPEEILLHARKFNQTCEHEGQCSDHRLTCNVEEHTSEKRCLCVKFHTYDLYSQQCLIAENMTEMLSQLIEQYDAQAEEADEAQKVFTGMMIAGCMVLGVGLVMATVCTVIACYRPSSKENMKYENVDHRRRSASRDLPSTSGNQRAVSPQRDGAVEYVPGMFDVSAI